MKVVWLTILGTVLAAVTTDAGSRPLPVWVEKTGWTLVHLSWLLAVIGLVAVILLRLTRSYSSRARYRLGVTLLGLMAISPGLCMILIEVPRRLDVTIVDGPADVRFQQDQRVRADGQEPATNAASPGWQANSSSPPQPASPPTDHHQWSPGAVNLKLLPDTWRRTNVMFATAKEWIAQRLPLVVLLWMAGMLCFSLRPVMGLLFHWRLRSTGLSPAPDTVERMLNELCRRLKLTGLIRVAESALIRVPLVVGYFRPLVLLPASVLTGLSSAQLEAVLAHELAHIRRHDWLVNLLQVVVETLLFFHPLVWWLSHQVHQERELCCDDLALEITGDRATLGRALLALEELRQSVPSPLLAATGGNLVNRIRRLLPNDAQPSRLARSEIGGFSLLTVAVLTGLLALTLSPESATKAARAQTEPPQRKAPAAAPASPDPEQRPGNRENVLALRSPQILLPDHWIMEAVAFDQGVKELITASIQGGVNVRRWDVAGRSLLSEIKLQADTHGRAIRQGTLRFSGDRRRLVAATDAYVGIWDTATGRLLKQLPFATKEGIYDCEIDLLDCTPDLSVIVGHRSLPGRLTLSYDAYVFVWDGATGKLTQTVIDKGATHLISLDLSNDGSRLVTTNGGGAEIWDTRTGKLLRSIPNGNTGRKHPQPDVVSEALSHVWSVQFSPDGNHVALGDILGVKLFDTISGTLLREFEGPYRYSSRMSPDLFFSNNGKWLARLGTRETGENDKSEAIVPIWSTQTGIKNAVLYTQASAAAFCEDGHTLAVVFPDMQQGLSVWQFAGSERARPFDPGDEEGNSSSPHEGTAPAGPGPQSRQDRVEENGHLRGAEADELIERFPPLWGKATLGLQYGIAFTSRSTRFCPGERIRLVYFLRNVSDKPVTFETSPDYFGNAPQVMNSDSRPVALSTTPLLGPIARYVETLEPGESLGPFYSNVGLGENPLPNRQHWSPTIRDPQPGKYKVSHTAPIGLYERNSPEGQTERISTPEIEFEIVPKEDSSPASTQK